MSDRKALAAEAVTEGLYSPAPGHQYEGANPLSGLQGRNTDDNKRREEEDEKGRDL